MLQKINERIQGWIAWLVILLIAVTFVLFGISYYLESRGISNVKTEVNGVPITLRQFDETYRRLKQQQPSLAEINESKLKRQALDQLIMNQVILSAAKDNGFIIAKEQAETALLNIPEFQEDGEFSENRFQQVLSAIMYTPESFVKQIKAGMLINQLRFTFAGTSFILPSELKSYISLINQKRDYRYIKVNRDKFLKQTSLTEKQLLDFYNKNKKNYMTKEQVSVQYILLSMKQILKEINISDEEVKNYYDENKQNYIRPVEFKITHILLALPKKATYADKNKQRLKVKKINAALEKGVSFEKLVGRYSDDLLSKNGELPWMRAGTIGGAFDKTVVQLKKGEISKPIKTDNGIEIIKLIDKKPATTLPFYSVKESIKKTLKADKVQRVFAKKTDLLTDLSYQNPNSLSAAAKALGLKISTTLLFTKQGAKEGIASKKAVIKVAFSNDVLAGDNSQPITLDNDALVVIRVDKHIHATLQPFSEVKNAIRTRLKDLEAAKLAKNYGEKIVNSLKKREDIEKLLTNKSLAWRKEQAIARYTPKNVAINHMAFTLPEPKKDNKLVIIGKTLKNGDYAIIQLLAVKPGVIGESNLEQTSMLNTQLASTYGIREYNLYIKYLMQVAKIKEP